MISHMISRVRAADLLPLATSACAAARCGAALSTLGIAVGIAAIIGFLGITRSSQADLLARVDRLGTNLLTVINGHRVGGEEATLPQFAALAWPGPPVSSGSPPRQRWPG